MKIRMENALTVKQAKQINDSFDINTEKAEVLEMWTTPEVDHGFGYETASFVRNASYSNEVYSLILDGELADTTYAIFIDEGKVDLQPTHWHE